MKSFSKESCIQSLQKCYTSLGKTFTKDEYNEWVKCNPENIAASTIVLKFDSWNAAKEAANISTFKSNRKRKTKHEKQQEIIPFIQEAAKILGNFFKNKDYQTLSNNNSDFPSIHTVKKYFRGIQEAKYLARIDYKKTKKIKNEPKIPYKKEFLKQTLLECYKEKGYPTIPIYETWRKQKEKKYPNPRTICKTFGSWKNAIQSLPIPHEELKTKQKKKRKSKKKNTPERQIAIKEQCKHALLTYHKEYGHPNVKLYTLWRNKNDQYPSVSRIINSFGSWRKALKTLPKPITTKKKTNSTVKTKTSNRNVISDETYSKFLSFAKQELGNSFTANEYTTWAKEHQAPSLSALLNRFGKWSLIKKELGIETQKISQKQETSPKITKEECTQHLLFAKEELGNSFTANEYTMWARKHHAPSLSVLLRYFEKWSIIRREFGIEKRKTKRVQTQNPKPIITKEECSQHLLSAKQELGNSFAATEYKTWAKEHSAPSLSVLIKHLGKWSDIREEFHIEKREIEPPNKISKEEIVSALQDAKQVLGDGFSKNQYETWRLENGRVNHRTIVLRFGSWENAKKEASISANPSVQNKRTKEECIFALQTAAKDIGVYMSARKYMEWRKQQHKKELYPLDKTIQYCFGKWSIAVKEAGLESALKKQNIAQQQDDSYIEKAIQFIQKGNLATHQTLRYELKIGSTRCKRIMDYLEQENIIGKYKANQKREIHVHA